MICFNSATNRLFQKKVPAKAGTFKQITTICRFPALIALQKQQLLCLQSQHQQVHLQRLQEYRCCLHPRLVGQLHRLQLVVLVKLERYLQLQKMHQFQSQVRFIFWHKQSRLKMQRLKQQVLVFESSSFPTVRSFIKTNFIAYL